MNSKFFKWGIVCLLVLNIAFSVFNYLKKPKIAFVRSAVVVENYLGMKEAKAVYEQKVKSWNQNIDTLAGRYSHLVYYLETNRSKMNKMDIEKAEIEIQKKEDEYNRYKNEMDKQAKSENERLVQGAFNQINSFVEEYSKKHHIDVVLGATLSGNVLYGCDGIDITNDILQGLNKSYK